MADFTRIVLQPPFRTIQVDGVTEMDQWYAEGMPHVRSIYLAWHDFLNAANRDDLFDGQWIAWSGIKFYPMEWTWAILDRQ